MTNERQLRIADNLRKAEAALQQSAEMFTTAFRSSLHAIGISLIPEGRFLAVNQSFLRMTGYTQEEVLGKPRRICTCGWKMTNPPGSWPCSKRERK